MSDGFLNIDFNRLLFARPESLMESEKALHMTWRLLSNLKIECVTADKSTTVFDFQTYWITISWDFKGKLWSAKIPQPDQTKNVCHVGSSVNSPFSSFSFTEINFIILFRWFHWSVNVAMNTEMIWKASQQVEWNSENLIH